MGLFGGTECNMDSSTIESKSVVLTSTKLYIFNLKNYILIKSYLIKQDNLLSIL